MLAAAVEGSQHNGPAQLGLARSLIAMVEPGYGEVEDNLIRHSSQHPELARITTVRSSAYLLEVFLPFFAL